MPIATGTATQRASVVGRFPKERGIRVTQLGAIARSWGILLAVVPLATAADGQEPEPASQPAVADGQDLDALVAAYFRESDDEVRAKLGVRIAELVEGKTEPVAEALGRVQLWEPQPAGVSRFTFQPEPPADRKKHAAPRAPRRGRSAPPPEAETEGEDTSTEVTVRLPDGYDPSRRYPLILALHGKGGRGEQMIAYLQHVMSGGGASSRPQGGQDGTQQARANPLDEFIVAAPTDYRAGWFNSPMAEAGDWPQLLKELRRRYHVDTERVYAVGYSMGGHGAFTLATLYGDEFAAAVPLAGTLYLPFQQAEPLLLANLVHTPVLAVWGEKDTGDDTQEKAAGGGIAAFNRRLRMVAADVDAPLKGVQLAGVGHGGVVPPLDLLTEYLHKRRPSAPREVKHWFRYPPQGRAGWLRQRRFAGTPWQGTQINVAVTGPMDIDEYVTKVLTEKLAYLGGRIEGQRIEATSRKSAELEVLLNDELIDLDQPITLVVGEKIRFEGKVERRVSTMLEIAYRDWEFQRLYSARLAMKAGSKAWEE